ncbi:sensor histidine kinase [Flavobacterium sp.]|uniref:tetratricopeptide repeat-containing sensor histidine kinase n=1 Tax=Flavobacterium sp. TaxID=239 RepID=UPI002626B053|nr:sensor histidine kinase [Flavobacterium sp.]
MKQFFKLLLIIIWCSISVYGQKDRNVLLQELSKAKQDTTKVYLLLDVAETYIDDPKKFKQYLQKSFTLSRKLKDANGEGRYYQLMAKFYSCQNDADSCVYFAKKGVENAKKLKLDKQAQSYSNLASAYTLKGYPDSTTLALLKAVRIQEKLKPDFYRLAILYVNLSANSYALHDYKKTIAYSRKALFYANRNPKKTFLAEAHINLGLGFTYDKALDSASYHYNRALDLAYKNQNAVQQLYVLENITDLWSMKRNYPKMLETASIFHKISKANPEFVSEWIKSDRLLGRAYLFNNQVDKAKSYAEIALGNSTKEKDNPENVMQVHYLMYEIETRLGNYSKAEDYYTVYDSIDNVFRGEETQQNINILNTKFKVEKKNAELKLQKAALQRKEMIIFFLSFGIVALVVLGWFVYKNREKKQKIETQIQQIVASKSIIKTQEDERARIAKDLHDGLGGLLSGVKQSLHSMKNSFIIEANEAQSFEKTIDILDQGIRDLRNIAHNMIPENLIKFGLETATRDYCSYINNSNALEVAFSPINMADYHKDFTHSVTVYRIIQELVHNAVKHAEAKNLIVQLAAQSNTLQITIEDDGKGFDTNNATNGIGISNVRNRVSVLEGTMQITSNHLGTTVNIELPI